VVVRVEQHVARLEVAVEHAALVRVRERLRDFAGDPQRLERIESRPRKPYVERLAAEQLEHEIGTRLASTCVVQGDDRGMVEAGHRFRLFAQPRSLQQLQLSLEWPKDLDGDLAIQLGIECFVHGAESAASELAQDLESADESAAQKLTGPTAARFATCDRLGEPSRDRAARFRYFHCVPP
jgi:hypothetical protein